MESKSKKTGIIVGIVAVLAIGGGIFWAMNMNNEDTTSQTEMTEQTQEPEQSEQTTEQSNTIVVLASETPALSTLVTAVKAASLVDTLGDTGPYTVFAPTNEAFEALPTGTLATLLKPENVDQLKSILTYHVVAGKVMASDLSDGQEITTVQGGKLTVSITDGMVYLIDGTNNKVVVEQADVNADNGVVHIIGGVLLPE